MTHKDTMQQALEALESLQRYDGTLTGAQVATAIESLRGALARQGKPIAYLAWRDGKPCYEGEDVVCADPVWPVDSDDDRTSMPVYTGAAPTAQSDARKVIEQMVVALEIAERHLAYVEITEAREAGQQRLEENK